MLPVIEVIDYYAVFFGAAGSILAVIVLWLLRYIWKRVGQLKERIDSFFKALQDGAPSDLIDRFYLWNEAIKFLEYMSLTLCMFLAALGFFWGYNTSENLVLIESKYSWFVIYRNTWALFGFLGAFVFAFGWFKIAVIRLNAIEAMSVKLTEKNNAH